MIEISTRASSLLLLADIAWGPVLQGALKGAIFGGIFGLILGTAMLISRKRKAASEKR